ncbi:MAG: hypothetical protein LBG28_09555 [Tannerella sp.]|jgi:hypothetical protein|nr:hypothetical protein [Tannerella sp.]
MTTATEKWVNALLGGVMSDIMVYIPNKIDLQKTTADEWIDVISRNINKNSVPALYDAYDAYDRKVAKNRRRALEKLPKIATKVKISNEYIVMSSFLNVMIDRENIKINEEEGNDMEEFTKKPYDFDYQISSKDIRKVLENEWEYLFDGKKNKWEIFSVTSHSDRIAPCPGCAGAGFIRCEHCDGSGREQYVAGNFATGEERIKTGQCSHCYGQGKIACTKCNGTGKIYLNARQTVKRFEDRKTILRYDCLSTSWEDSYGIDWYDSSQFSDWSKNIKENYRCNIRRYDDMDIWRNMDDDGLDDYIEKLYRNSKEIIIDKEDESARKILSEIGDKYKTLCKENTKRCNSLWREYKLDKGELGCSLVKHHAIPAVKITFTDTIENEKRNIYIFENLELDDDGERQAGMICVFEECPELGFIKSLFLR